MKKISFSILILLMASTLALAQNVTVFNGILNFATLPDYETIVEANDTDKDVFYNSISSLPNFTPLSHFANNNSLPDSIMEEANFVSQILNGDGVVKIGNFFYKINYANQKVYVLKDSFYTTHYNYLINSSANDKVGEFDMDFDIIDMVEAGILTQPSEEELNSQSERIRICWRNSRATSSNKHNAMYFRDLSDPNSSFGSCINHYDGTPVASTRLKLKVEYLTLGIWNRLDVDAKIQKPGKLGINNIPLWTTCNDNTGELNWSATFKAVFRGRCSSDAEQVYNPQDLPHPISNENKGRKVLWERVRGLRYYCVQLLQAGVYTNNAFLGPDNDQAFCSPNIIYSTTPRKINTPEFFPANPVNTALLPIESKIICQ